MGHTITSDNYLEAEAAIRDILFMYRDLIRSYRGFGHGIDTGTFNPFTFVDAEVYEEPGLYLSMDMDLIHQGCAVALLCSMSDCWDETGGHKPDLTHWGENWESLLYQGRLDHLPLAKETFAAGLESEDKFRFLLPAVYTEYVEGYFHRLLQEGV